jgi:hypothetical protein
VELVLLLLGGGTRPERLLGAGPGLADGRASSCESGDSTFDGVEAGGVMMGVDGIAPGVTTASAGMVPGKQPPSATTSEPQLPVAHPPEPHLLKGLRRRLVVRPTKPQGLNGPD